VRKSYGKEFKPYETETEM